VKDFRELKVWDKAHRMTLGIYRATALFPKEERYGLTSQLRRAASSIPANIAEGCGRNSDAEFAHFLQIAMGSASETEYHLLLARDLGILSPEDHQPLNTAVIEIKKMLTSLLKTIRGSTSSQKSAP
jgi:four helix bundle protein